ncbi:myrosinase 1-like isoform X2 [Euwallacea fornicatus]|uniref:myrosinase 1-like isoform X2 n=1 Tax=Euwallacea fornicatus TaxID=995702 RepID=UPI00338DFBC8
MRVLVFAIYLVYGCFADKQIPKDFILGAGTSAFQIEGGWNEDGKGESIWDTYLHNQNAKENGDVACDSYHFWKEDVENAKALSLDYYRILPNGTINNINQKGIDYYLNIIKALKNAGVEPMITIYHWDMPEYIFKLGGLLNPEFVNYFEDYARLLYQLYGPYVKYWITINEPSLICTNGYEYGIVAPGLKLIGDGIYQCSYILLKSHARAYRIYDKEFKSKYNGQVGIVINFDWAEPTSNHELDIAAQERHIQFNLGWWANPIYLGNWPELMIARIANRSKLEGFQRSRLPEFTQEEIDYINGTHDFFGLNTYSVNQVTYVPDRPIAQPSYLLDQSVNQLKNDSFYYPDGVRTCLNYIYNRYKPQGILITENGKQTQNELNDDERISTIRDYLSRAIDAKEQDKVNVIGYLIWSLMDNFEWGSYEKKFGIIHVDFNNLNRTRTWKKSAFWYQNVISTRILDV